MSYPVDLAEQRPADFTARIHRHARSPAIGVPLAMAPAILALLALVVLPACAEAQTRSEHATLTQMIMGAPAASSRSGDAQARSDNATLSDMVMGTPEAAKGNAHLASAILPTGDANASQPANRFTNDILPPSPGTVMHDVLLSASTLDRTRAQLCLTEAIYYEAGNEPDDGQRAVAQVVMNRVAHPAFPDTVCGVIFQGSDRSTGCQFTFTCDGSMDRAPDPAGWARAARHAAEALDGAVFTPVGTATHYHAVYVHPYWADSLQQVITIGAHIFYRWRGAAGMPAAFTEHYAGHEPQPAVYLRSNMPVVHRLAVAASYTPDQQTADAASADNTAQDTSDNSATPDDQPVWALPMPKAGTDKPDDAGSGHWLRDP